MLRMSLEISGDAPERLANMAQALETLNLVRLDFAERMKRSTEKTFAAGGRPTAWPPSQRVLRRGGKTLIDSATLKNSVTYTVEGEFVVLGTSVVYAAPQQFGLDKTVATKRKKGGSGVRRLRLPARPFLLAQDEDLTYLRRSLLDHLGVGR